MTYAIGSVSRMLVTAFSSAGAITFSSWSVSEEVNRMFTVSSLVSKAHSPPKRSICRIVDLLSRERQTLFGY